MTVFENAEILVSYELESIRKRAQVLQGARKELRSQYRSSVPFPWQADQTATDLMPLK